MSPRKAAADLVLGGPRTRRAEPAHQTGTLTWHHTEFGRRTDCETYRVVREGDGWQLLDADWTPIGSWTPTIDQAQYQAERHAARAARDSTWNSPPAVGVSETR